MQLTSAFSNIQYLKHGDISEFLSNLFSIYFQVPPAILNPNILNHSLSQMNKWTSETLIYSRK